MLKDDIVRKLELFDYARQHYNESIKEVPLLGGEIRDEKRKKEFSYLNIRLFMQTLLDRIKPFPKKKTKNFKKRNESQSFFCFDKAV